MDHDRLDTTDPTIGGTTRAVAFDALVACWLSSLPSANTRAAYRRDIELYAAWRGATGTSPLRATAADVARFRTYCEATGSGAATVSRRLAALSSFYRYAITRQGGTNPVEGARRPLSAAKSSTANLDDVEAAAVWQAALRLGDKTASIVGLVLLDGLKTSELLPVDVDHVTKRGPHLDVAVLVRGDAHVIRLHPLTAGAVRRHVGNRRTGPLLLGDNPTRERARLTRFGVDYLVKRAGAQAGLTAPLTVNSLRRRHIVTTHIGAAPRPPSRHHAVDRQTLRRYLAD